MELRRRAIGALARTMWGLLGRRTKLEGFDVLLVLLSPEDGQRALERLGYGLRLLAESHERSFRRLRRNVRRIVVLPGIYTYNFDPLSGNLELEHAMMLAPEYGPSPDPEGVAEVIGQWLAGIAMEVHLLAGTQRRLPPDRQERVARLVLRARLAFARKRRLDPLVEMIEEELAEEEVRATSAAQRRDALVQRLRDFGGPEFLIRLVKRVYARQVRRDLH